MILGTLYLDHKRNYEVNGNPVPYESALTDLDLPTLSERREVLTTKFAIKTFGNERHKDFFELKSYIRHCSRIKATIQEQTYDSRYIRMLPSLLCQELVLM